MKIPRPSYMMVPVALLLLAAVVWVRQSGETPLQPEVDSVKKPSDPGNFASYNPGMALLGEVTLDDSIPLPEPSEGSIPGEYTVFFKDAESMEAFREEAAAQGLSILGTIPEFLAVRVGGSGKDLKALLNEGTEIDSNHLMEVPVIPDDSFWKDLSLIPFGDGLLEYLGIPTSPDRLSWGTGVKIAVLDTGWLGHSAMGNQEIQSIDLISSTDEGEFTGHGTAVAGMIGSTNPFAPGVAPGAEIMSIRVLDGNGKGDAFTLAEGILTAVKNGADVINMSLGGYGDSRVLREAVDYAVSQGVVMVAASGNDGASRLTYPAAYETVIGVTAVDANDNRAPFANFGENLDVAAPGFQVHALWGEDEFIFFNGTSASSPIVAGMVARIIETGKASTPSEVYDVVVSEANDTGLPGVDAQYGAGIISPVRIEAIGKTGIYDLALADLYPAVEQSDGASFPLYVSLQNRGTDYIPGATVELSVNGTPYFYRFSGMDQGAVESIQIPVTEADLTGTDPFKVSAKVLLPDRYEDAHPNNNSGEISLQKEPGG